MRNALSDEKGDLDNARNAQQKALQDLSQAAQQLADDAKKTCPHRCCVGLIDLAIPTSSRER